MLHAMCVRCEGEDPLNVQLYNAPAKKDKRNSSHTHNCNIFVLLGVKSPLKSLASMASDKVPISERLMITKT